MSQLFVVLNKLQIEAAIFQHFSYWDYHLESTWGIFDIRCPNCGMTVADRPVLNDY